MLDNQISIYNAQLGERIRAARVARSLNQAEFGTIGGVGLTTQQKYEKGSTSPTAEYFFRLRDQGIDIAELLTGQPTPTTFTASLRDSLKHMEDRERGDFVEVEEIDLAYGMGATFVDDVVRSRYHRLPRQLVESITSTPAAQLTLARTVGDSMQPTLVDGDIVLLDRAQRVPRDQDAIWALSIGDIAMIKRVRVRGSKIIIMSDNNHVPPDEVFHDEVNIVGRVIFVGRRM